MPRFLAPITVAQEYVTSNETISGSETILGATSGKDSYWTTVSVQSGLYANYGSFTNNVSASYFYGNGSYLTNLNASSITSGILSSTRLPAFNGDIITTIGSTSAKVVGLQGYTISNQTPSNGQILQWNGVAWVPAAPPTGGSGGGGLVYFFNEALSAQLPTTNLPVTAHQLGRTALSGQTILTVNNISQVAYSLVGGFVTDVLDPNVTSIPTSIWDFNIWAYSNANINNPTVLQVLIYTYDGVNAPTLISTSPDSTLTDSGLFTQLIISNLVLQTTVLSTTRIYIEFRAKATAGSKSVTVGFGDSTPSHVSTGIPSVGGSGLVKTINGVLQTPASLLVDVDVATNAQISQSKIFNLVSTLSGKFNTTDIIPISSGGTGATTASNALSALGGFPISGGTITDGLTATSGTFSSYLSSPSLSGTHYGDGSKLTNINVNNTNVQIFSAAGTFTWTKPSNAKSVHILCIGAGGGGASGRVAAGTHGGGGGAGGGLSERTIPASLLGSTETVTVGLSGAGGASQTAINSQNAVGTAGGYSSFGIWVVAGGGGGGGTTATPGSASLRAMWVGIAGSSGGVNAAAGSGAFSVNGAAGGGGGGGQDSTPTTQYDGGLGGIVFSNSISGGQTVQGVAPGGDGGNAPAPISFIHAGNGGGGGASNKAGNGGKGGDGGLYGGGGGGGGACAFGFSSGAGGSGRGGVVVVTTYF